MARYYVQPIKDKRGLVNAWEVAKKHGKGTTRISDHKYKDKAMKAARREANSGDKICEKDRKGSIRKWHTAR